MRLVLSYLVQNPGHAARLPALDAFTGCTLRGFEILQELVDFCRQSPNMTTAQLLEIWHKHPAQSHLAKLATWELPGDDARQELELRDALTQLELQWTEEQIRQIPARVVDQGPEERTQLLALQQKRQVLISALQGD